MKAEFNLSKNNYGSTLAVKGDLTAQAGDQFKNYLHQLFEEKTERALSLKEVKSMDVSSLQLIQGFNTLTAKKRIQIVLPESQALLDLLGKTELLTILLINNQ